MLLQDADSQSPQDASFSGNGVHTGPEALSSPLEAAAPEFDADRPVLTLHYATSWRKPCIHGSLAGGQWQDFPLQEVSIIARCHAQHQHASCLMPACRGQAHSLQCGAGSETMSKLPGDSELPCMAA